MREGLVGWPPEVAEHYARAGYWAGRAMGRTWDWAQRAPDAVAVIDGDTRLTYRQLALLADGLADGLAARGLGKDDTILVQLPNCWEFVVLTLACLRSGIAPIMALPAHRAHELAYLAGHGGAAAVVMPDSFRDFDHQQLGLSIRADVECMREVLIVGDSVVPEATNLRALITPAPDVDATRQRLDREAPSGSDVAIFLLSGGTTGLPKIIPRTHDDYTYNARRCAELTDTTDRSTYLVALPAGHNFPLACPGILGTLAEGGRVVMARSPDPKLCFDLIEGEGVTVTSAVPAVAQRWIEYAAEATQDISSLEVLQVGGSRMPEELARRVRPALDATLQQAFGMAEGLINFTRLDDPDGIIVETQGRPMCADDEIQIVDDEDVPVPVGESGMLLARGPYTIRGYYRAAEHNARAFAADGWYRTGDVVHRHPSGNLVVDGRTKDVIVRGGEKISAEEVENLLYAVSGVGQVAAVAGPDPALGERVCVFVVPAPGSTGPTLEGIRTALTERGVAAFKVPEHLVLVDALPVTPVGKIDKKRLRGVLADTVTATGSAGER